MKKVCFFLVIMVLSLFKLDAKAATWSDNFNDGVIDEDKWYTWYEHDPVKNVPVTEESGVLNIDYPPSSKWGGLRSKALFSGDFDIRMKWQDWQLSANPGAYQNDVAQIGIQVHHDDGTDWGEFAYIFRGWFPNVPAGQRDQYISNIYQDGYFVGSNGAVTTPSDTSGYLGIEREGSTIDMYYSDVNYSSFTNWNQIYHLTDTFTKPVKLDLRGYTGDHTNFFHAEWDNVEVQADSIIPPQTNPPENLPQPDEQRNLLSSHLRNLYGEGLPLDPDKPTILISHGMNGNTRDWVNDMAEAIGNRLGDNWDNYNLAAWDWEKEASIVFSSTPFFWNPLSPVSVSTILSVAEAQGENLADELSDNNYTKELHLIGHSAGGTLIEATAKKLNENGVQVGQLTFLDTPTILMNLGSHDATTAEWADNYISLIGSKAEGAYNYFLAQRTHDYSHKYYTETINGEWEDTGFYWSREGGGWNDPNKPLPNTEGDQDPTIPRPLPFVVTSIFKETFETLGSWYSWGNVLFLNEMGSLTESSSAYLFEDLTIPIDANYFSFDFKFAQLGDGDYLTTHFNNNLLFWFDGMNFYGNDFWNSGLIGISSYAGQTGMLTFALNSIGEKNSQVWIDNLDFVHVAPIPEPSSFLLLGIGLLITIRKNRKKSRSIFKIPS